MPTTTTPPEPTTARVLRRGLLCLIAAMFLAASGAGPLLGTVICAWYGLWAIRQVSLIRAAK